MSRSQRVAGLVAVSALVLASCSSGSTDTPETSVSSGPSVSTESVFELRPGDCFDEVVVNGEAAEEVETLPMIDCDAPHDYEVFAVFDVEGFAFPSELEFEDLAVEKCLPLFEDYVGSAYETSRLDITWLVPTAEGWRQLDREMTCVLFDIDFKKLTESMSNSGE